MANERHGFNGKVYLGSTEIVNGTTWTLTKEYDMSEGGRFGEASKINVSGQYRWSGTLTAYHDQDAKLLAAALDGANQILILYPDGTDVTTYFTGNVKGVSLGHETGTDGGIQTQTFPFVGDGDLTETGFAA